MGTALGAALAVLVVAAAGPVSAEPIRLGSVSSEPARDIKNFQPFADYLAKRLRPEGVDRGVVMVAGSLPQMASFLREGRVDLYIDSPFPTLGVRRLSGSSEVLLRRWKGGVGEYHSVIFTRRNIGIDKLEGLVGKVLAFEDPTSTASYFLPKASLIQQGFTVRRYPDATAGVAAGEIGYVFSDDDENTIAWVLRGKVLAGAINSVAYERLTPDRAANLMVLHRTITVPRHIVSYRVGLDPSLVGRIKAILLDMSGSEEGRKVLEQFEKTTRFDELPGGPQQALGPLEKLTGLLRVELGL